MNALPMFLPSFVAFTITIVALILLRPLAVRLGLFDAPGGRKQHYGNVPLIGGVAMFLGLAFALLTLNISLSHYRCLIACSALLVITGILDDFKELTPRSRLFVQILVGLLMTWWGSVVLHTFGPIIGPEIKLGFLAIPITVFAVVVLINAVNMTDGTDGLAGSLGIIEFFYIAWMCYQEQQWADLQIITLIICVLFAFLWFNFPWRQKASIFMGDSGSMLVGFLLAWFCIALSQAPHAIAKPVVFLWIMAVPLWDMANVVWRRLTKGFSPFKPDRGHFHHYLLRCGFSRLQVTIIISLLAIVCGGIGLIGHEYTIPDYILFSAFLMSFIFYGLLMHVSWRRLEKLLK